MKDFNRVDYNLSISDLIHVDGFKEVFAAADMGSVAKFLYDNGMDVEQDYELVRSTHRNLRNQVVNGERFEGFERLDEAWIKSGYASLDARIAATEDSNLRHTLRTMSTQRNQEKIFD